MRGRKYKFKVFLIFILVMVGLIRLVVYALQEPDKDVFVTITKLLNNGKYAEAIDEGQKIIDRYKGKDEIETFYRNNAKFFISGAYFKMGKVERAREIAEDILPQLKDFRGPVSDGYPLGFQLYFNTISLIANTYKEEGNLNEAKIWYLKALNVLNEEEEKINREGKIYPYPKMKKWIKGRLQVLGNASSPLIIEPIIDELKTSIKEKDRLGENKYMNKLVEMGEVAVPQLYKLLKDENKEFIYDIALILGRIGKKESQDILIVALEKSERGETRSEAAFLLAQLKCEKAIPTLKSALKDDYKDQNGIYVVRENAASALKLLGIEVIKTNDEYKVK